MRAWGGDPQFNRIEKAVESHDAKSAQGTLQKTLTSFGAWNIVRPFLIPRI